MEKEKRAQKGTDPNDTPQNEAPLGSTPQSDPNAQNANTDDAMDTTSIENNVGSSPTLTPRPIEETLDDSSNQNSPGGSPDHEMTELENDVNQQSENEDAEVPSNTRGTRYNLRPNPNPKFSELYRYYMLRYLKKNLHKY